MISQSFGLWGSFSVKKRGEEPNGENILYSDRKILENEAELCNDKIKDHTDCQECGEDYLFYDEG